MILKLRKLPRSSLFGLAKMILPKFETLLTLCWLYKVQNLYCNEQRRDRVYRQASKGHVRYFYWQSRWNYY
jgi:hypothetical protein